MLRLGDIRLDLEKYDYCEIIYNLSIKGCERNLESYKYVYELLDYCDDYKIPYNCYEVVYDWDDYGAGDGADCVCFYKEKEGFLSKNKKFMKSYGKPDEE